MAYDVHLEVFEGPLDLLLYLIKKNDMEISEIPIAQITSEYLRYVNLMKELNLEMAGEFLVMASTLMQIKARMLLPSHDEEEEDSGPLEELKARLLEYQRYKEIAQVLSAREEEFSNLHYRPAPVFGKDDFTLEVSLFELIDTFRNVLRELPNDVKEIVYQEIPIEQRIREILDMFEGKQYLTFGEILKSETTRYGLIISFLAMLELIRLKQIFAKQSKLFDEIRVYRVTDDSQTAVKENPLANTQENGNFGN